MVRSSLSDGQKEKMQSHDQSKRHRRSKTVDIVQGGGRMRIGQSTSKRGLVRTVHFREQFNTFCASRNNSGQRRLMIVSGRYFPEGRKDCPNVFLSHRTIVWVDEHKNSLHKSIQNIHLSLCHRKHRENFSCQPTKYFRFDTFRTVVVQATRSILLSKKRLCK